MGYVAKKVIKNPGRSVIRQAPVRSIVKQHKFRPYKMGLLHDLHVDESDLLLEFWRIISKRIIGNFHHIFNNCFHDECSCFPNKDVNSPYRCYRFRIIPTSTTIFEQNYRYRAENQIVTNIIRDTCKTIFKWDISWMYHNRRSLKEFMKHYDLQQRIVHECNHFIPEIAQNIRNIFSNVATIAWW